jgi:hypothetical protein
MNTKRIANLMGILAIFMLALIVAILLAGCGNQTSEQEIDFTEMPTFNPTKTYTLPPIEPSPTQVPEPTKTPKPRATSTSSITINNFRIDLIVIEKQCFGSAGCLITMRPDLVYLDNGQGPVPKNRSYLLVYEVYGDEDGTLTFNLLIEGDQYTFNDILISTANIEDEISVKVVRLMDN